MTEQEHGPALINPENLPVIEREIASAVIFSSDGKVLMGRKDPKKGGVYADVWHIPGGGIEEGETLKQAAIREAFQETGIVLNDNQLDLLSAIGSGETEKRLSSGERVWCKMRFNRFVVHLDQSSEEIILNPGDDLVALRFFTRQELQDVTQIPGGREFFQAQGWID